MEEERWPPVGALVRGRDDQSFAPHTPMLVTTWDAWLAEHDPAAEGFPPGLIRHPTYTPVVYPGGEVIVVETRDLEIIPDPGGTP